MSLGKIDLLALGAIVLVLIIMNAAISACRFLKVEGSYMRVSTVLHSLALVLAVITDSPLVIFIATPLFVEGELSALDQFL